MSPTRAAPAGPAPPSPSGALRSHGATIFLVDKDDAVRDALAMSLRAAGHLVAAFGSGRSFSMRTSPEIRAASWWTWISDLGAAELLRTLAAAQVAMPAVITSRRLKRGALVEGLPPGPVVFLDKPFGADELLRLVRIVLASAFGSQPTS